MAKTYRYCPYCATALVEKFRFEQVRPICPACGFVYFRDPKVAVIALVIQDGRILLVQRAVDPGKGQWALPGGYMDADEMPAIALQRELEEEVGLTVQVDKLLQIYPMVDGAGNGIGIVLAYSASPVGAPELGEHGHDVQAAGWFSPTEVPEALAFESTITLVQDWLNGQNPKEL
jgi:8-oxo-dGTP diphosphatase